MKITVLVDNNTTFINQNFKGEAAASYYIEIDDKKILFDTGYSDIILENAEEMGIDLGGVTHIVLSHGHDDHAHGLKYLAEKFDLSKVKLIAHPGCFWPKYDESGYIGSPFTEEDVKGMMEYIPSEGPYNISENCIFLGEVPQVNPFETLVNMGRVVKNGKEETDYCREDSAIVCRTDKGLVVITGCSHCGICNIISYAEKITGENHFHTIIGGFHLLEMDEKLDGTIDFLKDVNADKLYPCHCISLGAKIKMAEKTPIEEAGVGTVVEI